MHRCVLAPLETLTGICTYRWYFCKFLTLSGDCLKATLILTMLSNIGTSTSTIAHTRMALNISLATKINIYKQSPQ